MGLLHFFKDVGWDIFLAAIPVVLACCIRWIGNRPRTRLVDIMLGITGLAWLAFMPNTCYLMTEWRHFLLAMDYTELDIRWQEDSHTAFAMLQYAVFYLWFSMSGVFAFAVAIRPVANLLKRRGATLWVWGVPFFILMSIGVYLGLILRFNSWNFLDMSGDILQAVMQIKQKPMLSTLVVVFAGILWIVYVVMDIWVDGLLCRWRDWRSSRTRRREQPVS